MLTTKAYNPIMSEWSIQGLKLTVMGPDSVFFFFPRNKYWQSVEEPSVSSNPNWICDQEILWTGKHLDLMAELF